MLSLPHPSLLFITATLSEVPAGAADIRQEHVLIQVLPLVFSGHHLSTNPVSLMGHFTNGLCTGMGVRAHVLFL